MMEVEYTQATCHLSVVGQDLNEIPDNLSTDFPDTKTLDLSFNNIQ